MNESALNQILERIKAKDGQSETDLNLPKPELNIKDHNARARDELDRFFTHEIVPRLSALHQAGRLPNLAQDALWSRVESLWQTVSVDSQVVCGVEGVKRSMIQAVQACERGETQGRLL